MHKDIEKYNLSQEDEYRKICESLAKEIDTNLPKAESKIWHGHPVWFLEENPIAGYSKLKDRVSLLFWSGQSFEEMNLIKSGKFKAAEKKYTSHEEIDKKELKRWLSKSKKIQWDYKNIVKLKGLLKRLK